MRYISIAALAISAPVLIFAFFLPDLRLPDKQNLVDGAISLSPSIENSEELQSTKHI